MNSNHTPRFKHDCERCVFIGRDGEDDMYLCNNAEHATQSLIRRYGDTGHEYGAVIAHRTNITPRYKVVYDAAMERGLIWDQEKRAAHELVELGRVTVESQKAYSLFDALRDFLFNAEPYGCNLDLLKLLVKEWCDDTDEEALPGAVEFLTATLKYIKVASAE